VSDLQGHGEQDRKPVPSELHILVASVPFEHRQKTYAPGVQMRVGPAPASG
jgi:hypothetical protein